MKVYVVTKTFGGYAREDADSTQVIAVLSNGIRAERLRLAASGCAVTEVEMDAIPEWIAQNAKELGIGI